MPRDARIDAYIERQADFARPILSTLREAVHAACPEVEEGIKWGMPAFLLKGSILANMAAFKAHASFSFWRRGEVVGDAAKGGAMGQFGRIASIEDLPPREELEAMVKKAAELAETGAKPARAKAAKPVLPVPDDLRAALDENAAAAATFEGFSPSCRREYVEWVIEAKRPETRAKRIGEAVAWMAEGKKRNWKYENC
jgi:uncharacterized protein YdeI (YjbR/CyaY-like superfamily)